VSHDESTAECPESDRPEAKTRPRTNAAHSHLRCPVSHARNKNAATHVKPSVIAMKAWPKRVPVATGERSP
jgi:hypothetical protein